MRLSLGCPLAHMYVMKNSVAVLLALLSSVSVGLLPQVLDNAQDPGFVVRDSSGRVRIASFEKDGAFGLKMLDEGGGDSIILRCWGRGESSIDLYGNSGRLAVSVGRHPGDKGSRVKVMTDGNGNEAGFMARDDETCTMGLVEAKGKGRFFCALNEDGASAVTMAKGSGKSERTVVLRNGVEAPSGDPIPSGMSLFQGARRVGGFLADETGCVVFLGDDTSGNSDNWNGVRLGWGAEKGAFMALRQTADSHGVLVKDHVKDGSGLQVGREGREMMRFAVGSKGPGVVLSDQRGILARLPE